MFHCLEALFVMLVCVTQIIHDQVQYVSWKIPIWFRTASISDCATAFDHIHRLTRWHGNQGLSGEYSICIEKPLVSDHAKS